MRTARAYPVHPRVCGEQPMSRPCLAQERRFIPACAGNRQRRRSAAAPAPVHPRVCGEQPSRQPPPPTDTGSSPRVRGTDRGAGQRTCLHRFIPACAGNSPTNPWSKSNRPVHPRVCGEQYRMDQPSRSTSGSSPRVRGTDRFFGHRLGPCRFIPACAGNRGQGPAPGRVETVHPRVCGEQEAYKSAGGTDILTS